jgi:hypothetical protein
MKMDRLALWVGAAGQPLLRLPDALVTRPALTSHVFVLSRYACALNAACAPNASTHPHSIYRLRRNYKA